MGNNNLIEKRLVIVESAWLENETRGETLVATHRHWEGVEESDFFFSTVKSLKWEWVKTFQLKL